MNRTLILVAGPTAIGKTDRAIELALQHNTHVLSADSRQVYKELNIGVARPSEKQLAMVPHHFIATESIHTPYNAGNYAEDARKLINTLFEEKEILIVCGGSGLYIKALLNGFDVLPPANPELRNSLQELYENQGLEALQKKLLDLDAHAFEKTESKNPQRLIRAIEIATSPQETLQNIPEFKHEFKVEIEVMNTEREELYSRINQRVDRMIEEGLEKEAKELSAYKSLNSLQTVGYKEWWPYFDGEYDLDFVSSKIKQNTRNYAKRQITWFKHQI
jgi:tRNA dimethylallyltransferase